MLAGNGKVEHQVHSDCLGIPFRPHLSNSSQSHHGAEATPKKAVGGEVHRVNPTSSTFTTLN